MSWAALCALAKVSSVNCVRMKTRSYFHSILKRPVFVQVCSSLSIRKDEEKNRSYLLARMPVVLPCPMPSKSKICLSKMPKNETEKVTWAELRSYTDCQRRVESRCPSVRSVDWNSDSQSHTRDRLGESIFPNIHRSAYWLIFFLRLSSRKSVPTWDKHHAWTTSLSSPLWLFSSSYVFHWPKNVLFLSLECIFYVSFLIIYLSTQSYLWKELWHAVIYHGERRHSSCSCFSVFLFESINCLTSYSDPNGLLTRWH